MKRTLLVVNWIYHSVNYVSFESTTISGILSTMNRHKNAAFHLFNMIIAAFY